MAIQQDDYVWTRTEASENWKRRFIRLMSRRGAQRDLATPKIQQGTSSALSSRWRRRSLTVRGRRTALHGTCIWL